MRWIGAWVVLAFAASPWAAAAQGSRELPVDITADTLEYQRDRDVYTARGNVHIVQGERTLDADWVAFSPTTRQGIASGDVVLVDGVDTLHAEFVQFSIDTLRGVVFQARLDSVESGFRLEGAEVVKTGDETFTFEEGMFTTCRCPEEGRDPWAIRAGSADVEVGGYGTARNTTFEILGVPVLWLPWMLYPLKTERESGLLLPEFNASSRNGGDFGLPIFWAARDDLNVVVTPSWLFERGFMPKLDIEYVFGERSYSKLFASYIHDTDIDPDDPGTRFSKDRWGGMWRHDQDLPWNSQLKFDVNLVSDNHYPFDFQALEEFRRDRFLESVGFLTKHFGDTNPFGLVGSVWWGDDLQSPENQDRDEFLLQRLPQVAMAQMSAPVKPAPLFVTSLDARYDNFWALRDADDVHEEAVVVGSDLFLDTGIDALPDGQEQNDDGIKLPGDVHMDNFPLGSEVDLQFEEGEPLGDRGHRLLLNPRIAMPLHLGLFDLAPEIGYHGTFYLTDEQDFEQRSLFTARVDLRSRLRRELELPWGLGEGVHLMEPRLSYVVVSKVSQSDNPLFIPRTARPQARIRQLDLFNITRDPADRIRRRNGVVVGLANRLYSSAGGGPGAEGEAAPGYRRLLADFTASFDYEVSGTRFGQLVLDGTAYPSENTYARLNFDTDLRHTRVEEGLLQMGWSSDTGHDVAVSYSYLRDPPEFFEDFEFDDRFEDFDDDLSKVSQVAFNTRFAFGENWAVTTRFSYSFDNSLLLTARGGVEFISRCRCWAIRLEIEEDRSRGVEFAVKYTLLGLGDDTIRPFGGGAGGRAIP